ncbi:MAG: hypothetical protein U9R74_00805 [Pseudomonadota bacterium]|nr:hypothetical protein [Pseudomonadota bacterium]
MNIKRHKPSVLAAMAYCITVHLAAISTAQGGVDFDIKIFPAGSCTQFSGSPSSIAYDYSGSIYNVSSTQSAYVNCPLVRDYMSSNAGIHNVHVHMAEPKRSWCRLRLVQPYNNSAGRIVRSTVMDPTTQPLNAGPGNALLLFNMIDGTSLGVQNIVPRNYRVYYTVQCKLDPGSRLISIRTVEVDP